MVVDNASGDGTIEMVRAEFAQVRLIVNERNLGYAAGNNQAIRASAAPFVLLLNPDTEVQAGALGGLLSAFGGDERVGAAAAQLLLPDGRIQRSCRSFPRPAAVLYDAIGLARLFPRSEVFGQYRMTYWDHSSPREVDQPMASALALRRAALDEVGLFDEDFPLYFNDVDLCYRLKQAGWKIRVRAQGKSAPPRGGEHAAGAAGGDRGIASKSDPVLPEALPGASELVRVRRSHRVRVADDVATRLYRLARTAVVRQGSAACSMPAISFSSRPYAA